MKKNIRDVLKAGMDVRPVRSVHPLNWPTRVIPSALRFYRTSS